MTETLALDRAAVAAADPSGQVDDALSLPEHLRDALWKVESAGLGEWDSRDGLVVAGMGGSAIGGVLARAVVGDEASRPILTVRGYDLPSWTTLETTVLCASYSGETEETLAAYEAAGALGARRVVLSTGGTLARMARADGVPVIPAAGGLQPRAAVGYMLAGVLAVARACGAAPGLQAELDVAAEHIEQLAAGWAPDADQDALPKALARALHETTPVVTGAGPTAPIAVRWKAQLNENAKVPAFASELPEADHNEIVGWSGAEPGRLSQVFLEDDDQHPRITDRIELTGALIAEHAAGVHRVRAQGRSRVERVLYLVLLGDLVSLYMAVLRGVDPQPVAVIEDLKRRLAERR